MLAPTNIVYASIGCQIKKMLAYKIYCELSRLKFTLKKHGKDRKGNQRFRCLACGKTYVEPKDKPLGVMRLSEEKALLCLHLLVEGNSIRSTERITNVHHDTIISLLETVGEKCLWIQENLVKGVKVADVQADEIWAFIGMKQKTANDYGFGENEKVGSFYTFTAIE